MEFLKTITVCARDSEAAAIYGELRAAMERKESDGGSRSVDCRTCYQPGHDDCHERSCVRDGTGSYG